MTDVVTIAHVGELHAARGAKALFDGHEVGQSLARMLQIAERINHRATRVLGHFGDGLVCIGAQHNQAHPALHVARHIGQRLALAQGRLRLVDKHRRTTQRIHAGFKGEASAQRGFLKKHHHLPGIERVAIVGRRGFHGVRQFQNRRNLRPRQIGNGAEIAAGKGHGGLSKHVALLMCCLLWDCLLFYR